MLAAEFAHADMGWTEDAFGLGYRNAKSEHGPLTINALAYQNTEQLLELLATLKGQGDQVYSVSLLEPSHLQMQDLIN